MTATLAVLHEDAHILVVSKPAGIPTQGPAGSGTPLEHLVRRYLRPGDPAAAYVGTVHRLDLPVSGVILWAKTPKAARRIAEQFARREAQKEYWALVEGAIPSGEGLWEDWLYLEDTGLGIVQVCHPHAPRSRHARTRFRAEHAIEPGFGISWLRLRPETGRRHQLRVQASARGLPIVGDRAYGSRIAFSNGIALHARTLTVRHPILEHPMTFEAPLPDAWAEIGFAIPSQPV